MLASKMRTYVVAIVVAGSFPLNMLAEICGCASNLCCSEYGYCGAGNAYCGQGCRQGPCYRTPAPGSGGVNVASVVTQDFFDSIINQAGNYCEGKSFYTRAAFLDALKSYSQFGKTGSSDDSKREIAAFFAHATYETGHFCNIEDINGGSIDYCDNSNIQYPCAPGKKYHGRGPLQLSWNFNYGAAGRSIGFDGINNPDIVGRDPVVSFKTALWFWMNFVRPVVNQGFVATIKAINGGLECTGGYTGTVQPRIKYYRDYCNRFGVAPGNDILSC